MGMLQGNETSFPVPKSNLEPDKYDKHPKGSVEGPKDPGYGQASASRTDHQRRYEKFDQRLVESGKDPLNPAPGTKRNAEIHKEIEQKVAARSDQKINAQKEISKDADTLTLIKRQAKAIKDKFQTAKKFVKEEKKKAADAAAKEKEEEQESEEKTAAETEKQAVQAEVDQLKQQELKNGVDTTAEVGYVDDPTKIQIAPTRNWVRSGRNATRA